MPSSDDLQLLVNFGLLNEAGISKLANLIRGVQMLSDGGGLGGGGRGPGKRRGRPPGSGRVGRPPKAAGGGKQGRRGSFTVSKAELAAMRKEGMTAKAIGEKHGVSMATVNLHLKKHGLTTPRKGKAKKK